MVNLNRGDLVDRPTIAGPVIAAVVETKVIGSMLYARVVDEYGIAALTPAEGLKARTRCDGITVGENDREIAALRHAMKWGQS